MQDKQPQLGLEKDEIDFFKNQLKGDQFYEMPSGLLYSFSLKIFCNFFRIFAKNDWGRMVVHACQIGKLVVHAKLEN